MFPYKTSFIINRNLNVPLYLQLANQFIFFITAGKLPAKTKLIGTRSLAQLLEVHRKTVVACYEELELQGWVESIAKKGTFVNADLPLLKQKNFLTKNEVLNEENIGFSFYKSTVLEAKDTSKKKDWMYFNDGVSDTRLTPLIEIGRIYRKISSKKHIYEEMSYTSTFGNRVLREVLVEYLNATRGLNLSLENLLLTRGSQMGIWLSTQLLLKETDIIVVGETNYSSADITFLQNKATLMRVKVDTEGVNTADIEEICKKNNIKAVYITSHHHHPTTVTLSAERRIHLLNLSRKYQFAIIEDDYDYDFNYNHAPILPLASHDGCTNVVYIGSVCKTVAPVFRIGYLIANKKFVAEASKYRGYVDRQGDALLELTFAEFIKSGDLDRHIRKVLKIYEERRNVFCKLLSNELSEFLEFDIPKGGMAIWVKLKPEYTWEEVTIEALKQQLIIGDWQRYDMTKIGHNSLRIGFASYTIEEIYELIARLKRALISMKEKR